MKEIKGKLSSEQKGIGTLSEGPDYWIEPIDDYKNRWERVLVRKTGHLWQDDPLLHPFIGKMVVIRGDIIETRTSITVDPVECEELKD